MHTIDNSGAKRQVSSPKMPAGPGGIFRPRPATPGTPSPADDYLPLSSGSGSAPVLGASAPRSLPFPGGLPKADTRSAGGPVASLATGMTADDVAGERPQGRLGKQREIPPTPPSPDSPEDFKRKKWGQLHALKRRQWGYANWLEKHAPHHRHLEVLKNHVSFKCRCGATYGKDPGIGYLHGDLSWFGLMKCGSIWGCPICSPVLMKKHEEDLAIGLYNAVEMGWTLLFITHTIPHKRTDDMLELMRNMDTARKLYGKGGTMSRLMKQLGFKGNVIRLEPTFGNHGIHPHTHTILMFDRKLTNEETERLTSYLKDKWKKSCIEAGLVTKKNERTFDKYGFCADTTGDIEKLIRYMTKNEKEQSVSGLAKEMTNAADKKRGRGVEGDDEDGKAPWGRSQWEVMEGFIAGDKGDTDLWLTFLQAFHRKSAIRWSPGLKEILGVEGEGEEHGVKIDDDEKEYIIPVYQLVAKQYGKVVRHGLWRPIIDVIADKDFEALGRISERYQIDFASQRKGYPSFLTPETTQRIEAERERQRRQELRQICKARAAKILAEREAWKRARLAAEKARAVGLLTREEADRVAASRKAHNRAKEEARRLRRE